MAKEKVNAERGAEEEREREIYDLRKQLISS
jgi:hypothetical protein